MEEKEIIEILKDFNDIKLERDKLEIERGSYKMGARYHNTIRLAIQGILDLYNEEKEKNLKQFAEIENLKYTMFNMKHIDIINKYYISKDKIREKIKKLENEFHFYAGRDPYEWDDSEFDGEVCDTLGQQIKVLKELLEEAKSYEKDKI